MKKIKPFVKIYASFFDLRSELTPMELLVLQYMLICSKIRGGKNIYIKGITGISKQFNIRESRTRKILRKLQNKGFIKRKYRVKIGSKIKITTTYERALFLKKKHGGKVKNSHFYVSVNKNV